MRQNTIRFLGAVLVSSTSVLQVVAEDDDDHYIDGTGVIRASRRELPGYWFLWTFLHTMSAGLIHRHARGRVHDFAATRPRVA